jgi:hypothetical protein
MIFMIRTDLNDHNDLRSVLRFNDFSDTGGTFNLKNHKPKTINHKQLHDLPIFHMQHPVALCSEFFIMGNDQESLLELFAQVKK